MAKTKKPGLSDDARAILEERARKEAEYGGNPDTPDDQGSDDATVADGEPPSSLNVDATADMATVEYCATLDTSDTDNGIRLRLHFGQDLLVIMQEKAKDPLFGVWTGSHWDVANGRPKSLAIAQRLGGRIALETLYLPMTPREQKAVEAAAAAMELADDERSDLDRRLIGLAEKAREAHGKRTKRRLDHAVSSKNVARMNAALSCLAPHIGRSPDDLNADPMKVAVRNATLCFRRKMERRKNPKFVSVADTPNVTPMVDVCTDSVVDVVKGHRRADLITHLVPVDYRPKAECPLWIKFLTTMLPDPAVRRLVQVSSGLGLLGITVQYLFFHYGDGANGKSVYMEVLCRLLGEVSVTLPATSFIGEGGGSGGASPDMARLYGRRMLRVKELPEGEDLRENLVKEVTGGETITARDLFSGYMDFRPLFIAMMSGNGYPKISGIDDGIWRRMAVVHWPVKVAKAERREFEEIVSSFEPEHSGILNWLIEGVHIFLREGLVIPEAVERATQDYRDDMDRTAGFVTRCVIKDENADPLQAKDLYQAYCDDTIDQGGKPMNNTAFGRAMSKKFRKDTSQRMVFYIGIRLVNVPKRRDATPEPPPGRFDDEPFPDDF